MRMFARSLLTVLMGLWSGLAWAEVPSGQSRELGIQFETLGGDGWCKPDVKLRLTAAQAGVFQPETVPFVQMIGRIRSILLDACPQAERLVFDAQAGKEAAPAIEMSRLTAWEVLYTVDPKTRKPGCAPDVSDCALRAEAFVALHKALRGDAFAETRVTTLLDDQAPEHAVWVSGSVVGKLTVNPSDAFGNRFTTAGQLAEAMAFSLGHTCRAGGGTDEGLWSETYQKGTLVFGLTCNETGGARQQNAFVVSAASQLFRVFSFFDVAETTVSVSDAARQVMANIEGAQ